MAGSLTALSVLLLAHLGNFHVGTKVITPTARAALTCNRSFYWPQFQSSIELMDTINAMCNTTPVSSGSNNQQLNSDACYGCFARVIDQFKNSMHLGDLNSCASTYLQGTDYQPCADEFAKAIAENDTETEERDCKGDGALCSFEKCIHRIDKLSLIKSCIEEVKGSTENGSGEADEVQVYIKTTACILAKVRCRNSINTAQPGQVGIVRQPRLYMYQASALLVTEDYDLRVTNVPHGNLGLTCGFNPGNIKVATWPGATC